MVGAMYAHDLRRERARADALAMRLSEHEPLEKSGSPIRLSTESAVALARSNEDANRRIIEAAVDIVFESQLDVLIALLDADRDAEKAK